MDTAANPSVARSTTRSIEPGDGQGGGASIERGRCQAFTSMEGVGMRVGRGPFFVVAPGNLGAPRVFHKQRVGQRGEGTGFGQGGVAGAGDLDPAWFSRFFYSVVSRCLILLIESLMRHVFGPRMLIPIPPALQGWSFEELKAEYSRYGWTTDGHDLVEVFLPCSVLDDD